MKRTTKYQLAYLEEGDIGSSKTEMQRWETVDSQLQSLYEVIGNGILEGWVISASTGLNIVISQGKGHIAFVSTKTDNDETLGELTPSSTQYVYATLTESSYWDQSVSFTAFSSPNDQDDNVFLGKVVTNDNEISSIDTDGRVSLGFINLIQQLISDHRHIGGTGNPPPINLSSEVQGVLSQNNLPDMDASLIKTGTLDIDRLPAIDHITELINQGTLTHAQLDAFVEALNINGNTLMGETSTIDLLQLILALKHIYPAIDEYLVNEIALIPGISPDSYIDFENTTATVDTTIASEGGTHTIYGVPTEGQEVFTKTWNTEVEFNEGTTSDVIVDGDTVSLDTRESKLVIDEFNNVDEWQVITVDSSSTAVTLNADTTDYYVAPQSGKLVIGDTTVEIALEIKREFDAQDWSEYDFLVVYFKTSSVQHGDIYFYLKDNIDGIQDSYTKVLDRNAPTINLDTLQSGWQEVIVDISPYTRDNINEIGFFVSTQDGWDTSKGFDFNIDNIYLTSGNKFKSNGYIREIFGGDYPYNFWRVRWDALMPNDAQSTGLELKMRTRVGNTLADLSTASWSAYQSDSTGSIIALPSDALYKYIEVEMYFMASTDTSRSARLRKIFLDFISGDAENSFNYDTQDDWNAGTLFNVDTQTQPGSMLISGTDEIDNIYYGTSGAFVQLDGELSQIYRVTGSMMPRSTYQIINNITPSFGVITGITKSNNGNVWICDTYNDRVVEVSKDGALVRGFFGSYLVENVKTSAFAETTTTTTLIEPIEILQVLYNSQKGFLYLIFNQNLSETNISSMVNKFLKVGTSRVYLDNYIFTYAQNGFLNVLQTTITDADRMLLNKIVATQVPTISILNPYEQKRIGRSVIVKFLIANFDLGTISGENGIRITIDGGIPQDIYVDRISLTNLEDGIHTVKAQLLNADGTLNTNDEAIAESTFVVYLGSYNLPYISIQTPIPNQVYSASPITVEFTVENFAIVSAGQHLRYQLDSEAEVDYYTTDPIQLSNIDVGAHTVTLWLVDERGNDLGYPYGSVTVGFNVGLNSEALTKFYASIGGKLTNADVGVYNLIFSDVYAPFDVQYIPFEVSNLNPSGKESILIGKLTNEHIVSNVGGV